LDDRLQKELVLLRSVQKPHTTLDITTVTFSRSLGLIATAANDGFVRVWGFQELEVSIALSHLQIIKVLLFCYELQPDAGCGGCVGHNSDPIAIVFLDPFPVLVSADAGGEVKCWLVSPHIKKYTGVRKLLCA
jgi:WD40 repeat protein